MGSPTEKLLSDASDIARRVNVQLLIIGGGLSLMWATTFEPDARKFTELRDWLAPQYVKLANKQAALGVYASKEANTAKKLGGAQKAQSECADTPLPALTCQDAKALVDTYKVRLTKIHDRQSKITKDSIDIGKRIDSSLSQEVSFDFGAGFRLPFSITKAPLIWLLAIGALLVRLGSARAAFWQLVADARERTRLSGEPLPRRAISLAPLWLNPAARHKAAGNSLDLLAIVGWNHSIKVNRVIMTLALAMFAVLIVRVAWIGILLTHVSLLPKPDTFDAARTQTAAVGKLAWDLSSISTRTWHPAMAWALAGATGIDLSLIVWFWLPHLRSTRIARLKPANIGRRRMIGLTGAVVATGVAASFAAAFRVDTGWNLLREAARLKVLRYRKRTAHFVNLKGTGLAPGWYQNRRSKHLRNIDTDMKARGVTRLNPSNLVPVTEMLLVSPQCPWAMLEGAILEQIAAGQVHDALILAATSLDFPLRDFTDIRRFDLAAGLAIRFGDKQLMNSCLEGLNNLLSNLDLGNRQKAKLRIGRWMGPEGQQWREKRWGKQYPLHWGGKSYRV